MSQLTYFKCPLGIVKIVGDASGISEISILDDGEVSNSVPKELEQAVIQLQEYFEGKRTYFDLKINPKGTNFQRSVWHELINIPFGKTLSYMELSKKVGDVKAIRAVASANGKNPIWIVIPCHRVIGADGSLTGYAGGLGRKKWLLDLENPTKQQSYFRLDFLDFSIILDYLRIE
jgi:methylated-DNA-[protein]-cysteine S-methyltransferase